MIITFLKNIFCKDCKDYVKALKIVRDNNKSLIKACDVMRKYIHMQEDKLRYSEEKSVALKDEIKKLLASELVDIEDFKDYYENKYNNSNWTYNFRRKGYEDVSIALRHTPEGKTKLVGAAKEIINKYDLYDNKTTPEKVIEAVVKYFLIKSNWTYKMERIELWELAEDSWDSRVGDCDALAILMHNLIYFMFLELELNHYWRLSYEATGSLIGGHALNSWIGSDGEYYAIESTLDLRGSFLKTWLRTPMRYNNLYANPWGFARKNKSRRGGLGTFKDDGVKKKS